MKNERQTLGLKTALSMVIGTVIGSGIFLTSSNVIAAAPYSYWPMVIWLAAGLISLLGCVIFAELGARLPKSGGQYIYLFESFGPLLAYLYGWTLIAVIQSGAIAAEASIFAQFASTLWGHPTFNAKILAGAIIVGFTGLNILGLKKATDVLDLLTFLKMLALVMIPLSLLFFFDRSMVVGQGTAENGRGLLSGFSTVGPISFGGFGVALIAAFWAYDGWNSLGYIAGDLKNPTRNIPLATIGGMIFVIVLYLCVNWSYQFVMTPAQIAASSSLASDVMTHAFGRWGGFGVSIAVMITTLGTTNAFIIAGSRIIFAMAQKGGLPKALAKISSRAQVPVNAFMIQMVWSLVLLSSGKFDELFTCVISVSFIFYGLTALGLIVMRKKTASLTFKTTNIEVPAGEVTSTETDAGSRMTEGSPLKSELTATLLRDTSPLCIPLWIPWVYVTFCLVFTVNNIVEKPRESLIGLGLALIGVPAFYIFKSVNKEAAHVL